MNESQEGPSPASCRRPLRQSLALDDDAGLLAVPGVGCDAFGAQEVLLHFLGRRARQVVDDAEIARYHEMGEARAQEAAISGTVFEDRDGSGVASPANPGLADVLVFWVDSLEEKDMILADDRGIFFTTPHWHGYKAVLTRIPRLKELRKAERREFVENAWLTRAPNKLAKAWLAEHGE